MEEPGIDTHGAIDDDGLAISPDGRTAVVQYGTWCSTAKAR